MIDKFNFYDIYGYFLPGATFLAILWLPLGLVRNTWPSSDWSSAIIAAVLAYLGGHLLEAMTNSVIPSSGPKNATGAVRLPSETLLDLPTSGSEYITLPVEVKDQITSLIKTQFGLELSTNSVGDESIDKIRNNAFLLARQVLIQGKSAGYAEQFQGMYALTRGLVSVFALATFYWLGWAVALFRKGTGTTIAILLITVSLLVVINISIIYVREEPEPKMKRKLDLGYGLSLMALFLGTGYILGVRYGVSNSNSMVLALLSALAVLACVRVYSTYKYFSTRFASSVWRDYVAYNAKPGGCPPAFFQEE